MNEQQFGQEAAKAQAKDAINKFNVGAKNNNANLNWNNQQNISNKNTDVTNDKNDYNLYGGKEKERYQMQTGQSDAAYRAAKDERDRLDRKNAETVNMITGLAGQGIRAYAGGK